MWLTYITIRDNIFDMDTNKPFIVTIDGQVDKKLSTLDKRDSFQGFKGEIKLQAEMLVYDLLHGTNYRTIRNTLLREQRNRAFEKKLGLTRNK